MTDTATVRELAQTKLSEELPRRWSHVSAVARQAASFAPILNSEDADMLVRAAWLHDIGYAPDLVETGFHPLDGARFLRGRGVDKRLVALVAHHSYARIEADERGLAAELAAEFPHEDSVTADALCYCDMTTGPDGQQLPVRDRLNEIRSRYGPADVVTRFIDRAAPELLAAAKRTETLLERAGVAYPM